MEIERHLSTDAPTTLDAPTKLDATRDSVDLLCGKSEVAAQQEAMAKTRTIKCHYKNWTPEEAIRFSTVTIEARLSGYLEYQYVRQHGPQRKIAATNKRK